MRVQLIRCDMQGMRGLGLILDEIDGLKDDLGLKDLTVRLVI